MPGTLAVAFNCAVLSAVPHAIDAGLTQVIVGVGVVGAGEGAGVGAGLGVGVVGVVVGVVVDVGGGVGVGAGLAPGLDVATGAVVAAVDESAGVSPPPPQAASTRLNKPITMLRARRGCWSCCARVLLDVNDMSGLFFFVGWVMRSSHPLRKWGALCRARGIPCRLSARQGNDGVGESS